MEDQDKAAIVVAQVDLATPEVPGPLGQPDQFHLHLVKHLQVVQEVMLEPVTLATTVTQGLKETLAHLEIKVTLAHRVTREG